MSNSNIDKLHKTLLELKKTFDYSGNKFFLSKGISTSLIKNKIIKDL